MRRLNRLTSWAKDANSWVLIGFAGSSTYGNWPATASKDVVGLSFC
jgi:hypothetical protein